MHPDVDAAVQPQQSFLGRAAERRPVVVRDSEVTLPRIEVRIEVDDGHWPELPSGGPKQRQGDGVIATQGDDVAAGSKQRVGACFDLRDRFGDDEWVARDVTRVRNLLVGERLDLHVGVVRPQQPGSLADRSRPEPRTGAVRDPAVEWDPDDRDVARADFIEAGQPGERRCAGKTGNHECIERAAGRFTWHSDKPYMHIIDL